MLGKPFDLVSCNWNVGINVGGIIVLNFVLASCNWIDRRNVGGMLG